MTDVEAPKNTGNLANTDAAKPAADPAGEGLMSPMSPILRNANALYVWQSRRLSGRTGARVLRWQRGLWFLAVHFGRRPAAFDAGRTRLSRSVFWVFHLGRLEIWFRHPVFGGGDE